MSSAPRLDAQDFVPEALLAMLEPRHYISHFYDTAAHPDDP